MDRLSCARYIFVLLTICVTMRQPVGGVLDAVQAKALNNIRSATKSISESVMVPMEVNLDMAVEYIQVRHLMQIATSVNSKLSTKLL